MRYALRHSGQEDRTLTSMLHATPAGLLDFEQNSDSGRLPASDTVPPGVACRKFEAPKTIIPESIA